MRRLIAFAFALLLAMQAVGAWARPYTDCCDACQDLAMRLTVACKACPAQVIVPTHPAVAHPGNVALGFSYFAALPDDPAPSIWQPPR